MLGLRLGLVDPFRRIGCLVSACFLWRLFYWTFCSRTLLLLWRLGAAVLFLGIIPPNSLSKAYQLHLNLPFPKGQSLKSLPSFLEAYT